jgi:cardiolipin synthase
MSSETTERSTRVFTVPNLLTIIRLGFIPLILAAMWREDLKTALVLFLAAGVTDFLDGLTARLLNQRTVLGLYLDPIADKLLLSSSFLVLAITGQVPWIVTGLVLARDGAIIVVALVVMAATDIRRFPPNFLGKANTTVQLAAVFAVMLDIYGIEWIHRTRQVLLLATPILAVFSGFDYAYLLVQRLRRRPAPQTTR